VKWLACLLAAALAVPAGPARAEGGVKFAAAVATPDNYLGRCPVTIAFTGTVFVVPPVTVRYRWERSDGTAGKERSVRIAGVAHDLRTTWHLGAPPGVELRGAMRLHVLAPRDVISNPAAFSVACH
jgi:hypothetical protein